MEIVVRKTHQLLVSSAHMIWTTMPVLVVSVFAMRSYENRAFFSLLSASERVLTAPLFVEEVLLSLDETRLRMPALIHPADISFEYFDVLRLFLSIAALADLLSSQVSHDDYPNAPLLCQASEPDADISGTGVLISAYILLFLVFISLLAGTFHGGGSGTKELGTAIMCNQIVMAVNILQTKGGSLTPTDLYIVLLMLDAHAASLSATLSSKDVLASRWYVGLTLVVQSVTAAAVIYTLVRMVDESFYCADCYCDWREIWDHSILTANPRKRLDRAGPILYWLTRTYDTVQSAGLALLHTRKFDKLERLHRQRETSRRRFEATGWSILPSTAFSNWRGFLLHPVLLVVAIRKHFTGAGFAAPDWREWGQSAALIICACGVGHWLWTLSRTLRDLADDWSTGELSWRYSRMVPVNASRLLLMGEEPRGVSAGDCRLLVRETEDRLTFGRRSYRLD